MIKLEMTVDDETSLQDIKCALAYQDAYSAISNIRGLFRNMLKHGELYGYGKPITEEQMDLIDKLDDRISEIVKYLPELL
jgi:hypothetical protein